MKVKIETVRLTVNQELTLGASMRQLTFIKSLMKERGLEYEFIKHFTFKGKIIRNHITMASASKLIDSLKKNKEIEFILPKGFVPKGRTVGVKPAN